MSEQDKDINHNKLSKTTIKEKNNKMKSDKSNRKLKKSASVKTNDIPDTIKMNNSNVFKMEKLSNFRKEPKHTSQKQYPVDQPDVLFGINEFKELSKKNRFHSVRKLKSNNFSQDLPDTFEPLYGDYYSNIPRPSSMSKIKISKIEESKNPETANIKAIKMSENEEKNENNINNENAINKKVGRVKFSTLVEYSRN